ncbi:unnamed protein product [Somion occarium]|uniref:Uncharacterized protein n=1 Tax=Somion occarium TaxID=3059160 RepID=A0ABP1DTJ5_9APHY
MLRIMSESILCPGCDRPLSVVGYAHYLKQTTNPKCKKEYLRQQGYENFPGLYDSDSDDDDDGADNDDISMEGEIGDQSSEGPRQFIGDYFSNDYGPEDFPGFEEHADNADPPLDHSSSPAGDIMVEGIDEVPWQMDVDEENETTSWELDYEGEDEETPNDDGYQDADDNVIYKDTTGWEPPAPSVDVAAHMLDLDASSETAEEQFTAGHCNIENSLRQKITVVKYPSKDAGTSVSASQTEPDSFRIYGSSIPSSADNPYSPFPNRLSWEICRWAKLRGPGSTALSELLSIEGIQEGLELNYKNSRELNRIIDTQLPGRPQFRCKEIVVAGEVFEVYHRPIMECIKSLYGNHKFAQHLIFAPERHYADKDMTMCMYHDMHTGK